MNIHDTVAIRWSLAKPHYMKLEMAERKSVRASLQVA